MRKKKESEKPPYANQVGTCTANCKKIFPVYAVHLALTNKLIPSISCVLDREILDTKGKS